MFIHNHSEIGSIVQTPFQSGGPSQTVPFSGVTNVVTAVRTGTVGNFVFITVGGIAAGTVSSITIAGFTEIFVLSSRLAKIFYKKIVAGEPSTYTIVFNGGGTLGGHYRLIEVDGNTIGPVIPEVYVNELGSTKSAGTPGVLLNLTDAPYNVLYPSLALAAGNLAGSQTGMEVNNGFAPGTTGQSGAFKIWQRIYTGIAMGELTSAYHPTLASAVSGRMTVITGRRMF